MFVKALFDLRLEGLYSRSNPIVDFVTQKQHNTESLIQY